MKKYALAFGLGVGFALCSIGCEGDAEKINGSEIKGVKPDNAPTQQGKNSGTEKQRPEGAVPGGGMPGGGAAPGEAAGKTSSAFPAQSKPINPNQIPSDYPRPEGEAKLKDGTTIKVEGRGNAPADAPKEGEAPKAVLTDEEKANIAKLAEADQQLALAQAVCLISGESLGSMGTPIRVEADGKVGFLCCKGCKKKFDADPAKALAKAAK